MKRRVTAKRFSAKRFTARSPQASLVLRMPFKVDIYQEDGKHRIERARTVSKALRVFDTLRRSIEVNTIFVINEKRGFLLRTFYRSRDE